MPTVLIIGATRGIGYEFAKQYTQEGQRVIATHRKPEDADKLISLGARALPLNVLDMQAIAGLVGQLDGELIDLAIVNAGVTGQRSSPASAPTDDDFDQVMHTNVRAPMQLMPVLAPLLAVTRGKLVVLSSRMGSVGLMNNASSWLYRASKAALNSALRAASLQWGPQGVVCLAMHPGWVRTDMGGAGADLDVVESVTQMRRVIAAANDSHNGKFLNYNGEQIIW